MLGIQEPNLVVGYAGVSSHIQKDDLESQIQAIRARYPNIDIITDIGSGLSHKRRGFQRILDLVVSNQLSKLIVAYKDRLTRLGFEVLEMFFEAHGAQIEVLNRRDPNPHQELVEDLIAIISSFAGKLYGMRLHKYKQVVEGATKLLQDC